MKSSNGSARHFAQIVHRGKSCSNIDGALVFAGMARNTCLDVVNSRVIDIWGSESGDERSRGSARGIAAERGLSHF